MGSWSRLFPSSQHTVACDKVVWRWLRVLCGLALLFVGCNSSGQSGTLAPQGASTPASPPGMEQRAVENLLALYRMAIVQADIDRLSALLQPGSTAGQLQDLSLSHQGGEPQLTAAQQEADTPTLLATMSAMFRTRTITAFGQQDVTIAADRRSASFLAVESAIDLATLAQQTRVSRTTLHITPETASDTITFYISRVQQTLLATVTTPGQIQAGALRVYR